MRVKRNCYRDDKRHPEKHDIKNTTVPFIYRDNYPTRWEKNPSFSKKNLLEDVSIEEQNQRSFKMRI